MAKKDAVFNYSSAFDTSSYLAGVQDDWNNNVGNSSNDRMDLMWYGDPTVVNSGSQPSAISGWDEGKWKVISPYNIAFNSTPDGFASTAHKLIYDIKRAFNLPNQENWDTWKDEYTVASGEYHILHWSDKTAASHPMIISQPGWVGTAGQDPLKCALIIGISGLSDYGGDDNSMSYTVRPTQTNVTNSNTHYKNLTDASTAAADYTNPTKVGTEFTSTGDIQLVNFENHWQPTPASFTKDQLKLVIMWSTHTYAQIKTLVDTAIA